MQDRDGVLVGHWGADSRPTILTVCILCSSVASKSRRLSVTQPGYLLEQSVQLKCVMCIKSQVSTKLLVIHEMCNALYSLLHLFHLWLKAAQPAPSCAKNATKGTKVLLIVPEESIQQRTLGSNHYARTKRLSQGHTRLITVKKQ